MLIHSFAELFNFPPNYKAMTVLLLRLSAVINVRHVDGSSGHILCLSSFVPSFRLACFPSFHLSFFPYEILRFTFLPLG
jgi:hypothetical protein